MQAKGWFKLYIFGQIGAEIAIACVQQSEVLSEEVNKRSTQLNKEKH